MSHYEGEVKRKRWTLFLLLLCTLGEGICAASVQRLRRSTDDTQFSTQALGLGTEQSAKTGDDYSQSLEKVEELHNSVDTDQKQLIDFPNIHDSELRALLSNFESANGENIADSKSRDLLTSIKDGRQLDIILPTAIPVDEFPHIFKDASDNEMKQTDHNLDYEEDTYYLNSVDGDYTYYGSEESASYDGITSVEREETIKQFNKLPHVDFENPIKQNSDDGIDEMTKQNDDADVIPSNHRLSPDNGQDGRSNEVVPLPQPAVDKINPKRAPRIPPKFMLDLYNKFSKKGFAHPTADVVRSFMNINEAKPLEEEIKNNDNKTRIHSLLFNVTSISTDEDIRLAELRLYTLVERDRNNYFGVNRKVSVYEVKVDENNSKSKRNYFLLSSRPIYGRHSGWETFKITPAVRRWVWTQASLKTIEIWIESVFDQAETVGDLDIDTSTHSNNDPLLIVFSNEKRRKTTEKEEVREMIAHEMSTKTAEEINESLPLQELHGIHSRISSATNSHVVKTRSVDEQINDYIDEGDDTDESYQYMSDSPAASSVDKKKRQLKRKLKGRSNMCRRKPMYVNFADLGWDNWIIAPRGYNAFQCVGKCYLPLSDHLTPSKHAIVQTLLHTNYPRKAPKVCCVPSKLDPISILYVDEKGVVTYKYKYDGMVVASCGCR